MTELQKRCINKIEVAMNTIESNFGVRVECEIVFNLKRTTALGVARGYSKIRLDSELLEEYGSTYIDHVALHEYAHIVVSFFKKEGILEKLGWAGKRVTAHGREFKRVCALISEKNISSASTSLFSDSKVLMDRMREKNAKKKVFYYTCGCGLFFHEISTRTHNSIQRGLSSYCCNHCKKTLKWSGKSSVGKMIG